jgi:phosphohistidine phosphatase
MISSSAVRTATTARAIAAALGYPSEFLQLDERLYLATPEDILAVVREQDNGISDLMLFGHNPGFTDLVNGLLPELRLDNLPTSGAVAIDFATDNWQDVARSNASLAYYDYPKNPEILLIED